MGNFGERLICNWFSRSGFEVAIIDHTGIDIVAYNPCTNERLGITVKSRTRDTPKNEMEAVNLFKEKNNDRKKVNEACKAFACDPWIAIYVETQNNPDLFLTSLKNFDEKYRGEKPLAVETWKMGDYNKKKYEKDENVKHVNFSFETRNWNW